MKRVSIVAAIVWSLAGIAPVVAAEFFVSPAGSDADPGSKDQPFATLGRARDALRAVRGATEAGAAATIWRRGGTHWLSRPFELGKEDSGRVGAPLVIRGVEGEPVTLCGARRLSAADFKPVTDPATRARIAPEARGKIVELKLRGLGVSHARRYPDVFTDNGVVVELHLDGSRMPMARYPNEGYMTIKRVIANGGGQAERGKWGDPKLRQSPGGPGVFEYRDDRHARWVEAARSGGLWLKGYWRCVWQNEAVRVAAIDPRQHTVTLAKPLPGGIGSNYHRPEGSGEEKYWLLNLLEELDRPGEWRLDFASGKIFFWPPKPLATAEVMLADNAEPVVRLVDASRVVLRQLTIEGGLDHGVVVRGGAGNLIAGCTVRNVSRYGVVLDGGRGHTVQSCDLHDLGAGGVWLGGGDKNATPRGPAGHRVVNNHIHRFARIANNVTVNCPKPYAWQEVKEGRIRNADESLASGRNLACASDPGFTAPAKFDFRLAPEARVFKDLPDFKPIPFEKIGLYVDEYRRRLPTAAEAGRLRTEPGAAGAGHQVLDRD